MKKLTIAFLLCSTLLFSACSTDKKAESTDLTAKPSSTLKRTDESKKKKAAEEKRISEEAEKKKQEEISKKVLEADTAMKAAETNPTDETVAAAKRLVEAVPGGNDELQKRLETVSAKLESIKQQAQANQAQINQQQVQQNQTTQQEPAYPGSDFIDADGNGFDDRSVFNDPAARAEYARGEAEEQRQWEQSQQRQNDAVAQVDQYREDFKAQNGREPTSGEIQSQWLQEQGIE